LHYYQLPPPSSPLFFNLSSTNLSSLIPVINLGLKHILIPKDTTDEEIKNGINQFKHKLGWSYFFQIQNRQTKSEDIPKGFKLPNAPFHFSPPFDKPLQLVNMMLIAAQYYSAKNPNRIQNSAPSSHSPSTIKSFLTRNPQIKMVASDKNLGLVALDLVHYDSLVIQHLSTAFYEYVEPIFENQFFQTFLQRVKRRFAKLFTDYISDTESKTSAIFKYFKHCLSKVFSIPAFHVLVKIHKGLSPLYTRPIVGAVNWYTTPVSILLSQKLRPYMMQSTSIATNTFAVTTAISHFVLFNSTRLKPGNYIFLVTLDVKSLYTNIDLEMLGDLLRPIDLLPLFNFVSRNNYFQYNQHVYRQTNGIAMGTNAAPELANYYLMKLLDPTLENNRHVVLYQRYLDDLLVFWNSDLPSLMLFIQELNSLIPGIEFEHTISNTSADYLDLNIKYQNRSIAYATHQKALNKYCYITPQSCHPTHTKRGFIKGELTRYATNSSNHYYYKTTKDLFYKRLLARGYQHSFLAPIFTAHQYSSKFKSTLPRDSSSLIVLPIRYSYRSNLHKFTRTLSSISKNEMPRLLHPKKMLVAWKKSPNLFSLLSSSKLSTAQSALLEASRNV
jgi:hypothetical protein